MTWASTWKDILKGGPTRWKVDDVAVKQAALKTIVKYHQDVNINININTNIPRQQPPLLNILCPLAGDDLFVVNAFQEGHSVTSIDIVPEAVSALRQRFGVPDEEWESSSSSSSSETTIIWKHSSGRATLYAGDMLEKRPELNNSFDAVYDKDSFGALDLEMRSPFCRRLADYLKENAIVYTEVKYKEEGSPGRNSGPPYHVEKSDLIDENAFGIQDFQHIAELGKVYDLDMAGMQQTGHILKRSPTTSTTL